MGFGSLLDSTSTANETVTNASGQGQVVTGRGQSVQSGALGLGNGASYTEGGGISVGKGARLTIYQGPSDNSGLVGALQQVAQQAAQSKPAAADLKPGLNFGKYAGWIILGGAALLALFALRKKTA